MQRRRTAAGYTRKQSFPQNGRFGATMRNSRANSKKTSASIFLVLLACLFALVYVEKFTHHEPVSLHANHKKAPIKVHEQKSVGKESGSIHNVRGSSNVAKHKPEKTEIEEKVKPKIDKPEKDDSKPHNEIAKIRETFYLRFGGKEEAEAMLNRGVKSAGSTPDEEKKALKHTAERIIQSMNNDKRFVMSFGGYSVTVGRGNYYKQSYPFIMEGVLKPVFESLSMDLVVRNSAIGGIPSMPYGWCLKNFLGDDSDVVSWDYGMNEGNGASAFESYIRQSITSLSKRPMMILLDNKRTRIDMMKAYHKNGYLLDSIALGRGEVVSKELLAKEETNRPIGLQRWDEWGAPKGSPGQSNWHPKKMEHELIGWMLAMHFLDAIDIALGMIDKETININPEIHAKTALLPKPLSSVESGSPATPTHILYGTPIDDVPSSLWHMDPVSCRTSFLPNIHGGLSEIIVSGQAEDVGDDLKSRDDSQYNSGWVIDVGKVERATKRKVMKVGGLGYIDMKNALYGIPGSGTLRLSLPHEGPVHNYPHDQDSDMLATHWFDTLVFCEVNEKRGDKECKPSEDMEFIVGGIKSESVVQITNAASYLKKSICINIGIPSDARVTVKDNGEEDNGDHIIELDVNVSVSNKAISRANGACSISHIVWQSH